MIRPCTCSADKSPAAAYQHKKYDGRRVYTEATKGKKARCTICSTVHIVE